METTVNIRIGGLCLFVEQAASNKGLFALMPAVQHSDPHKTFLVFDRKHTGGQAGKSMVVEIPPGTVVPLRGLSLEVSESKVGLPVELAPVSKFGRRSKFNGDKAEERRPVAKRFTRDAPDPRELLCRIELDLGLRVHPCGPRADCYIDFPGATEEEKSVRAVGVVYVSFKTTAPFITIAGTNLFPEIIARGPADTRDTGVLNLGIHNIDASDDVLKPKKKGHKADEPVAHFHAYYGLLEEPKSANPKLPKARTKDEGQESDGHLPTGPCQASMRFVDPYRCMSGGGCEDQFAC